MRKSSIVVGLGYGDEGKGITVASLVAESAKPLVIRFNGGQQAGHTVVHDGVRHVHSTFGSGTLHGAPTYVSRFCTFDPMAAYVEYKNLQRKLFDKHRAVFGPFLLYVDPRCPVTLPWDVMLNRDTARHGTTGMGVRTTLNRHDTQYRLCALDLMFPNVWKQKVRLIGENAYPLYLKKLDVQTVIDSLEEVVGKNAFYHVLDPIVAAHDHDHYIFEGAQGIMLDKDHGYYPYCTPSHCTSRNAQELIGQYGLTEPTIYMVTRPYLTRHGNGPLINEELSEELSLRFDEHETNVSNEWQGGFRRVPLDIEQVKYAIACENLYSQGQPHELVMTCMDQVDELIVCTYGERLMRWIPRELVLELGFDTALLNYSAQGKWKRVQYDQPVVK